MHVRFALDYKGQRALLNLAVQRAIIRAAVIIFERNTHMKRTSYFLRLELLAVFEVSARHPEVASIPPA